MQPRFCPFFTWNPNGITFARNATVGMNSFNIFISKNNTIYVANRQRDSIFVWFDGSVSPDREIFVGSSSLFSFFVTDSGGIYVDNGSSNGRIDRWTLSSTTSTPAMSVPNRCDGMFIDTANYLFCSIAPSHIVIKKWLNASLTMTTTVAGTGSAALSDYSFNFPQGIFVDLSFNLYVADSRNDRVQLFPAGSQKATTIAGAGTSNTIDLHYPTGITVDANGYIFILDTGNNRVVASGAFGFRCLFGCSRSASQSSTGLDYPYSAGFDSRGNMFVLDTDNSRIQKFLLASNSCSK